jgi:hypothetical protein
LHDRDPGCAARPWAMDSNRFAVAGCRAWRSFNRAAVGFHSRGQAQRRTAAPAWTIAPRKCATSPACRNYSSFRRWLITVGTLFGGTQASSALAGIGWEW